MMPGAGKVEGPRACIASSDTSGSGESMSFTNCAVFAAASPSSGRPMVRVPFEPFVKLLHSPVWTDRNKASLALARLSDRRDPNLLALLRRDAMTPLMEMARWKSEGHALPSLMILGRLGGLTDDAIQAAVTRGEREGIITAALKRP